MQIKLEKEIENLDFNSDHEDSTKDSSKKQEEEQKKD